MAVFNKKIPYNDLPSLPPRFDIETKEVLLKTIGASRALANLNGALTNLPNPTLFVDTIHLQEAKASSEIENIITTNDDLYKAFISDKVYDNNATKEVLNYREALWLGLEKLEKKPFITTNLCIQVVQSIKKNESGIRTTPGTTLSNASGEVIYTPPSGETIIREKLANLEEFVNEQNGLDPLIKMAIMHYQFEAIHPFVDGNGRTGRILLLLYLTLSGLLDVPAIYFSGYIIRNKREYYETLRDVTEKQQWEPYILYMLDMVEKTAKEGLIRLNQITDLMSSMSFNIKEQLPKVYSKDLIEVLFRLPYTKRQHLIETGLGTPKTVGNYLIALEEKGFLISTRVGKEKLYINHKLLDILER